MIYMEIQEWQFQDIMRKPENGFSYEGSKLLFEILSDFGGDYELDPIGLRCTYSELSFEEAAEIAGFTLDPETEEYVDEDGDAIRPQKLDALIKQELERQYSEVYGDGPFIVVD